MAPRIREVRQASPEEIDNAMNALRRRGRHVSPAGVPGFYRVDGRRSLTANQLIDLARLEEARAARRAG